MENNVLENEICAVIAQINPKTDIAELQNDDWLTDDKRGLSAIDMTYLFFTLEKQYKISLDSQDLKDYGFATVQGIAQAVQKALQEQGRNQA